MKIYINRFPINGPWGGGARFINAFHKYVPELGYELVPPESMSIVPDVVLLAGLDNDGQGGVSAEQAVLYKLYQPSVKLVLRVNENDARKGTSYVDNTLKKLAPHMDGIIFVSNWIKDYFMSLGWGCRNNCVIVNGVDKDTFKPQPKLNNGKLNLLMSHWSDNCMKGRDYAEWLDDFTGKHHEFAFTYVGRTQACFKHSTLVKPLSGKALGMELGKHDVCINATRFDPAPNSVIEPITCGLPTYVHKDGGGAVELAGDDHVFSSPDELERLLLSKQFVPNTTKFTTWTECIQTYVKYLESVCGKFR